MTPTFTAKRQNEEREGERKKKVKKNCHTFEFERFYFGSHFDKILLTHFCLSFIKHITQIFRTVQNMCR